MKDKARGSLKVDGVFDIETEGWDKFVVGAMYARGEMVVRDFRKESELVDAILDFDGVLWAHNGGKYDTLWLASHVIERKIKARVFAAGQRVVCLQVGKLEIRDSAAIIPLSLAQAADIAGEKKTETGLECECGDACGGYCAIRRDISRDKLNLLISYLENDCRATHRVLVSLTEYAEEKDLDLAGTIGASAWKCASRWLDLESADWHRGDYEFARLGYYGGRTQVFQPRAEMGFSCDINSAYPAALAATPLPIGARDILTGREASQAFEKCREGIYMASVKVAPSTFIPPLPVRLKDRIGYPVGSFEGVWTRLELAYALGNGASIEKFTRAIVWADSRRELEFFARRIWDLRAKAIKENSLGKKGGLPQWLKLYANSLTGKLAQHPGREVVVMNPDEDDITFCPADPSCQGVFCDAMPTCCLHKCKGTCGRWRPLDLEKLVWEKEVYAISSCAHVQWAAYLTAAARVELHTQLVCDSYGGRTAVYCDTDSCKSTSRRSRRIGSSLGEWEDEGEFRDFISLAPKVYSYLEEKSGKRRARAKGIQDAEKNWERISIGMPVQNDRGVNTFRTAVKERSETKSLFVRKFSERVVKNNQGLFGDRKLAADGKTYPQDVKDLKLSELP